MVKKIVRDPFFLQQKSEPATEADKQVISDLIDTLKVHGLFTESEVGYGIVF